MLNRMVSNIPYWLGQLPNPRTVSTMALRVSTINGYHLPWISTLNTNISTFTVNGNITTPQRLASLTFPYGPATYELSRKVAFTKLTGGVAQECHGCLILDGPTVFPTFPAGDTGLASLPLINNNGASTFTTVFTTISVLPGNLTRDIYYFDGAGANYTASLIFDQPVLRYTPPPS